MTLLHTESYSIQLTESFKGNATEATYNSTYSNNQHAQIYYFCEFEEPTGELMVVSDVRPVVAIVVDVEVDPVTAQRIEDGPDLGLVLEPFLRDLFLRVGVYIWAPA